MNPDRPMCRGGTASTPEREDPGSLKGHVALVTGASSGIGRAISLELARHGATLYAVGRNKRTLGETVVSARTFANAAAVQADLTEDAKIAELRERLEAETGRLDILVHSSGIMRHDLMKDASTQDLDLQYAANLRAPYVLTQALLPLLKKSRGQIVFINSSLGLGVRRPEAGQYAAMEHALKAIADSLREEVNSEGIRVLSIYLGRTATLRQMALHQAEGKPYLPETLIQPEDVAAMVYRCLLLPHTAEVTDISIRPMINPRLDREVPSHQASDMFLLSRQT